MHERSCGSRYRSLTLARSPLGLPVSFMLPRARTVSEVPNGTSQRSLDRPLVFGRHPGHPDTMTCSHQILASATIPSPIVARFSLSQPPGSCPRCELVGFTRPGPDSTSARPSLTVSTRVVSANAIAYGSQLDLIAQRFAVEGHLRPALTSPLARGNGGRNLPRRGAPPNKGPGSLWREGAPGAGQPQDRHHLQRPTSWPRRCWPPVSAYLNDWIDGYGDQAPHAARLSGLVAAVRHTAHRPPAHPGRAATTLLLSGVPVHVVAARMGHADPAITLRVYAHVIRTAEAAAADIFANAVSAA